MAAFLETIEKHHTLIMISLAAVILFFIFACTFNNAIPVCHYLFGCDHNFHG